MRIARVGLSNPAPAIQFIGEIMPLEPLLVPFGTLLNPQYRQGLVGHWKMNAGGLIIPDLADSHPKNNGTLTNFDWNATSGWAGQGLSFDGVNDYVDVGNGASLNITGAQTVEAWVNPITTSGIQYIISKRLLPASIFQFMLIILTGKFAFYSGSSGVVNSAVTSATIGWHHLVGVWDGTNTKIYLDGVYKASATTPLAPVSNAGSVIMGKRSDSISYFNGLIDDVRIYNRALSAGEVEHSCFQQEDEWELGMDDDIFMQGVPIELLQSGNLMGVR
jgi:hypothetical protein